MYHVVQKSLGEPKNKELENKTTLIVLTKKKQTNYIYYDSKHLEKRERVIKVRLAVLVPSIS